MEEVKSVLPIAGVGLTKSLKNNMAKPVKRKKVKASSTSKSGVKKAKGDVQAAQTPPINLLPTAITSASWSDDRVEEWLTDHPEFFFGREQLANKLMPPNLDNLSDALDKSASSTDSGKNKLDDKVVSFKGWTQERLFQRIEHLNLERQVFLKVARKNESIIRSMMDIALAVTVAPTLDEAVDVFKEGIRQHYKVEGRLINTANLASVSKWAKSLLNNGDVYYSESVPGEVATELRQLLSITVGSFVLARIKLCPQWVAVFASDDPKRYNRESDRDSLFLEGLLQFVGARIMRG